MMKEMYSVKCPEHIVFGDPWYFKTEPKDRLKGLVVDCTVPKEFEAIVALESVMIAGQCISILRQKEKQSFMPMACVMSHRRQNSVLYR